MSKKSVLIITYYWPPAGGAGIQRVVKLVKYMLKFGWIPTVLTVEGGDYPVLDPSFEKEIPSEATVIRSKIYEPHRMFKKLRPRAKKGAIDAYIISQKGGGWADRLGRYLRLNVFIPDARIGWYPSAVAAGNRIIKKNRPDVIFTTSPPHSLQLIGRKLSRRHGIPWVADFRDPWLEIVYYQSVRRSKLAWAIDRRLERKVLSSADAVVSISDKIIDLFRTKAELKYTAKIPNGYDPADFNGLTDQHPDSFILTYTGVLSRERVPHTLLKCLADLLAKGEITDFQLRIVGKLCSEFEEAIADLPPLKDYVEFVPYVPHEELVRYLHETYALLLVIDRVANNEGFLSGKIFDYIGAQKPILAVGPVSGEANELLRASDCGVMVDYDDDAATRQLVLDLYASFRKGDNAFSFKGREAFSRIKIAEKMTEVFDLVAR